MNLPVRCETQQSELALQQSQDRQYLTFQLAREMFAIGILCIKEILEYGQLTGVPMTPNFIRGVINLRGAVVPVIDLSARFGGAPSTITKRSCIVIIEVNNDGKPQDLGVIVDAVSEVLEIATTEIEPPPCFGTGIRTDFIHSMGKVDGQFVIILDVDKVLSQEELAMAGQVSNLTGRNSQNDSL